jgi:hypothetical protein
MFGSDYPSLPLDRLLREWDELGYSAEIMDKVFHANAERVLALRATAAPAGGDASGSGSGASGSGASGSGASGSGASGGSVSEGGAGQGGPADGSDGGRDTARAAGNTAWAAREQP